MRVLPASLTVRRGTDSSAGPPVPKATSRSGASVARRRTSPAKIRLPCLQSGIKSDELPCDGGRERCAEVLDGQVDEYSPAGGEAGPATVGWPSSVVVTRCGRRCGRSSPPQPMRMGCRLTSQRRELCAGGSRHVVARDQRGCGDPGTYPGTDPTCGTVIQRGDLQDPATQRLDHSGRVAQGCKADFLAAAPTLP